MYMANKSIEKILRAAGFKKSASVIADAVETAVGLSTTPVDDDKIALGVSKIGGLPDISKGMEWPQWRGRYLSFLAQINLTEFRDFECMHILPKQGLLSFFYDADKQPWGYDPNDRGRFAVIYCPDINQGLIRESAPADVSESFIFNSCTISATEIYTYPPYDSQFIKPLSLDDDERNAYFDFLNEDKDNVDEDNDYEEGYVHQFLGHPRAIQGDMQLECQLVTNGLYCGDETGYNDPRAKELEAGANDWHLLLSIGSDDCADMMWGDEGKIYFWIKKEDLARRDFTKVWAILQCH
jgi:uncharacterized protein YwqG